MGGENAPLNSVDILSKRILIKKKRQMGPHPASTGGDGTAIFAKVPTGKHDWNRRGPKHVILLPFNSLAACIPNVFIVIFFLEAKSLGTLSPTIP